MPRKAFVRRREVAPDPVYGSVLASKIINKIMQDGRRSVAESIFYGALDVVKEKSGEDPIKVLQKALDNIKPVIEVKSRRVGGATYQVPVEVRPDRRLSLGIRWMIDYAGQRPEKTMRECLAGEILDAANLRGSSVKKREDTHKMAEANKAFAHYRW
jgi:small subunit ribosomal protein S7